MLRSFGIFLTTQASAVAALALCSVLASGIQPVRRVSSYLFAATALTAMVATVFALGVVLLESARQAPWELGQIAGAALVQAWLSVPLVVAISLLVSRRNLVVVGFGVAAAALTSSLLVQFHSGEWSAAQAIASMACFASASVLANVHCDKKT